jgi:hypothetical protein
VARSIGAEPRLTRESPHAEPGLELNPDLILGENVEAGRAREVRERTLPRSALARQQHRSAAKDDRRRMQRMPIEVRDERQGQRFDQRVAKMLSISGQAR